MKILEELFEDNPFIVGQTLEELTEASLAQAYVHARIAETHELALEEVRKAKQELEYQEAIAYESVSKDLDKPTVDRIRNTIRTKSEYQKALTNYNEKESLAGRLKAIREASHIQKDMLVTASANLRKDEDSGYVGQASSTTKHLKDKIDTLLKG